MNTVIGIAERAFGDARLAISEVAPPPLGRSAVCWSGVRSVAGGRAVALDERAAAGPEGGDETVAEAVVYVGLPVWGVGGVLHV